MTAEVLEVEQEMELCQQVHRAARLPMAAVPAPDWSTAACVGADPTIFHPEGDRFERERVLSVVNGLFCQECPIRSDCEAFARANNEEYGIWGGVDFEPLPEVIPKSNVSGVSWHRLRNKWVVKVGTLAGRVYGGYFEDQHEAEARARQIVQAAA